MREVLFMAGLTAFYLVSQECLRRCHLKTLCFVFGALPLMFLPVWAWTSRLDGFVWLKLASVFAGLCWAGCLRFTDAGRIGSMRLAVPWILTINMGEAMLVDLLQASLEHAANALAAMSLMLSIPFRKSAVRVNELQRWRDLEFDLPRHWIVGYTLWNWSFVMLNYPAYAGHHLAILLSALIVAGFNPKLWMQARAATLGLNLLCYASNPAALLSMNDASEWSNNNAIQFLPAIACIWVLLMKVADLSSILVVKANAQRAATC